MSPVTHRMSHVTYINESSHAFEGVMSHIWMRHVAHTYESSEEAIGERHWKLSDVLLMSHVTHRMSPVTYMKESCNTYECVMPHIGMSHLSKANFIRHWNPSGILRMSHAIHVKESCHIYEGFMSHMSRSYITRMNESYHTYEWVRRAVEILQACSEWVMSRIVEWVVSYVWMSHVTIMKEECHAYEWFVSYICISHVKHINGSCDTYKRVMSQTWMGHACHARVMSHIWMSHVTRMNGNIQKSCHAHKWVHHTYGVSRVKRVFLRREKSFGVFEMSHVTLVNWVMLRIWVSYFTHVKWAMSHIWERHAERERERERERKQRGERGCHTWFIWHMPKARFVWHTRYKYI